jgi:hypothetical protein
MHHVQRGQVQPAARVRGVRRAGGHRLREMLDRQRVVEYGTEHDVRPVRRRDVLVSPRTVWRKHVRDVPQRDLFAGSGWGVHTMPAGVVGAQRIEQVHGLPAGHIPGQARARGRKGLRAVPHRHSLLTDRERRPSVQRLPRGHVPVGRGVRTLWSRILLKVRGCSVSPLPTRDVLGGECDSVRGLRDWGLQRGQLQRAVHAVCGWDFQRGKGCERVRELSDRVCVRNGGGRQLQQVPDGAVRGERRQQGEADSLFLEALLIANHAGAVLQMPRRELVD